MAGLNGREGEMILFFLKILKVKIMYILFLLCAHGSALVRMCVHQTPWGCGTGHYEPPYLGTRNQNQVLFKNSNWL